MAAEYTVEYIRLGLVRGFIIVELTFRVRVPVPVTRLKSSLESRNSTLSDRSSYRNSNSKSQLDEVWNSPCKQWKLTCWRRCIRTKAVHGASWPSLEQLSAPVYHHGQTQLRGVLTQTLIRTKFNIHRGSADCDGNVSADPKSLRANSLHDRFLLLTVKMRNYRQFFSGLLFFVILVPHFLLRI